jgi:hypothetical protein
VAPRRRSSNASRQTSINESTIISSDSDTASSFDDVEESEAEDDTTTTATTAAATAAATARTKASSGRRTTTSTTSRRQSAASNAPEDGGNAATVLRGDSDAPIIPRALLARLIQEGFDDKAMKIGKEAMTTLEAYTKLFVREAIARSREEGKKSANGVLDAGWLKVEDLEKIAPQLMLDF